MNFNKEYTEYWQAAISKSMDGLKIPGADEAAQLLKMAGIVETDKILDLGCSYGRMYEVLSVYSKDVHGVDPDPFALEQAIIFKYTSLTKGTAECTGMLNDTFNFIFSWQVFDVVDQLKGFFELNRILKDKGKILVTGKNYKYFEDDIYAFKAEKNAAIKNFPNHFTKLDVLKSNIEKLGFKIIKLLLFPRRGDFGLMKYYEADLGQEAFQAYEYLIICEKYVTVKDLPDISIDSLYSTTSDKIAKEKGFNSALALFESIGID